MCQGSATSVRLCEQWWLKMNAVYAQHSDVLSVTWKTSKRHLHFQSTVLYTDAMQFLTHHVYLTGVCKLAVQQKHHQWLVSTGKPAYIPPRFVVLCLHDLHFNFAVFSHYQSNKFVLFKHNWPGLSGVAPVLLYVSGKLSCSTFHQLWLREGGGTGE